MCLNVVSFKPVILYEKSMLKHNFGLFSQGFKTNINGERPDLFLQSGFKLDNTKPEAQPLVP